VPEPTIQEKVGTRIRELRKARGWTLEQLAERADKHYTYIGGLERGDRNATLEVLNDVAKAFDLPLQSFVRLSPHPLESKLNASAMAPRLMLPRHSSTMASHARPEVTCSSTAATKMRVPRNVGCPWQIRGSLTI
jgi:transcriptional regulator with XRE-family HTH domain